MQIRTVQMDDPWLGKRTLSADSEDALMLELMKDQYKLLTHYRDDGRIPTEKLLEDIKAYEYVLRNREPIARAVEYFNVTSQAVDGGKRRPRPREVAKALGWVI